MGCMNYLIDSHTIYTVSVLVANAVLWSIYYLSCRLDVRWFQIHLASSTPAFISLLFLPLPFSFHKYGAGVRAKCKYEGQSDLRMKKLRANPIEERKRKVSTDEPETVPEKSTMEMERFATRGCAVYRAGLHSHNYNTPFMGRKCHSFSACFQQ